ncbi:MAG: hypothetical protein WCP01_00555 [Methylococcaceae bacterium]|jgi:predicted nucleic-acid-binding protein
MTGLDTNILARYYIQDEADKEAEKQHQLARTLIESGQALMVCKTVMLEFEWVMRGYYHFSAPEIVDALHHASYINCDNVASFDDKKFARRATRLGLNPAVIVPK